MGGVPAAVAKSAKPRAIKGGSTAWTRSAAVTRDAAGSGLGVPEVATFSFDTKGEREGDQLALSQRSRGRGAQATQDFRNQVAPLRIHVRSSWTPS